MAKSNRRRFLARASVVAAAAAMPSPARAQQSAIEKPAKKVHWSGGKRPEKTPLFSGVVSYGNLIFIAGIGAHFDGDIRAHTNTCWMRSRSGSKESGRQWKKF